MPCPAKSIDAVCGKCGAAIDVTPGVGECLGPLAGILRDTSRCEHQPWQRCPQLLAIVAGCIGRDMLDDQS